MEENAFFEQLYRNTREALLQYLKRVSGREDWAEDILQDTYLEAYQRRGMLTAHPNPAGWLYKTALNLYRNAGRKKENANLSLEAVPEGAVSWGESRYESAEWRLTMEESLEEKDRRLLGRYYLEGYSVREIAEEYQLTEGCIRVRLLRIRRRIRVLCQSGEVKNEKGGNL